MNPLHLGEEQGGGEKERESKRERGEEKDERERGKKGERERNVRITKFQHPYL